MNQKNSFSKRHIGLTDQNIEKILNYLGYQGLDELIKDIVPRGIKSDKLNLHDGTTETQALEELKKISKKNRVHKSYIGQGYYGTVTPGVILRNVFENPGWYTSYTPYQSEISQGRLEALINFQTMVTDLTDLEISNASLLDEATAAAEAMTLCKRISKSKSNIFFIDKNCFSQTIKVLKTRAKSLNIQLKIADADQCFEDEFFGSLFQNPGSDGLVKDFSKHIAHTQKVKGISVMATDLLALSIIKTPGEMGADISIGSSQRFGVPMGFGGPHAAFISTREEYKRFIPGRIVGASIDSHGSIAYRLALQTREQHIRREKATSNICTAQALLAIMAGMYAVYHGPEGIKEIATEVNLKTRKFGDFLEAQGYIIKHESYFDTLVIKMEKEQQLIIDKTLSKEINLRVIDSSHIGVSFDETTSDSDIDSLKSIFGKNNKTSNQVSISIQEDLIRQSEYLTHEVFNSYHSETEMLRYLRSLCDKDIALDRAMIPLGSCTMKLNATSEMIPVSWKEFSEIHPYAPKNQIEGYLKLITDLESWLSSITGYEAVSLQPNAGSQGEYAGLLAIDAYHKQRGDEKRNICLIPKSAHGTNPASAQMVNMIPIPVECDDEGNIDIQDLKEKAEENKEQLAAIMITYPSTHGVFEDTVKEVCEIIHRNGGQVYIDGANLNAMVGICYPGEFGGDVSHLNLHKTFCIPHGGGGPGVGPIGVKEHLKDFLPGFHEKDSIVGPVSASNWGSASILPISWMYIRMMGSDHLKKASEIAILNANYIAKRLQDYYKVLYKGSNGLVAHECILDVRDLKELDIEVEDIAKRLIDYGFHAPTMSWPVPGTLMIEPTESESKKEIDRFCEAMISIKEEIQRIKSGTLPKENNMLKNAPHTSLHISEDEWTHPYSRLEAAYPTEYLKKNKYWPPVGRVDNVYGDRNLTCSCPSMKDFD